MMTDQRTPISNTDEKIDLIEHLNTDHLDDIDVIVSQHSDKPFDTAILKDIYEEGCVVNVKTHDQSKDLFIPFTIKGELEEKIIYLSYNARIKSGEALDDIKKQYFEVVSSRYITQNLLQIQLSSNLTINPESPDFAYLFTLKKLEKIAPDKNGSHMSSHWLNKLFLMIMRVLSSKQRQKILLSMYKDKRFYTVRKAWQENGQHQAYIDIFLHGDTAGSTWAKNLKTGDIILSTNQYKGHTAHLSSGKTVLIADETAFPALASMLETWNNPIAPHIITISHTEDDQSYFDGLQPIYQSRHKIIASNDIANKNTGRNNSVSDNSVSNSIAKQVIAHLSTLGQIDGIWGGFEGADAKEIRKYARNTLKIAPKHNRVSGYWAKKKGITI